MKTRKTSLTAVSGALLAAGLLALSGCQRGTTVDTRTFALKHLDSDVARELITPYVYGDREGTPGTLSTAPGAITVRETPDNLQKIQRVLDEYDVARPDIRLHFQLIEADGFTDTDPAIAPVEAQLRKVFQFNGYRLVGEAFSAPADRSRIRQSFAGGVYSIEADVLWTQPNTLRLDNVRLWNGPPAPMKTPVLGTTVNIKPGQTLILGTAAKEGSKSTLLLTLRAEKGAEPG